MAKTFLGVVPQVGDYCYHPFAILKPGKIISVIGKCSNDTYDVKVKWLDDSVTEENTLYLNDFNHATDEHLKKYIKLDAVRQRLKVL